MAAGEILIKWVSESSGAIRDMKRVDRALGDSANKSDRWSRRVSTAHRVVDGAMAAWVGTLTAGIYAYSGMVKAAQEDASAQAVLENTARRAAGATQTQVDALNDYIDAAATATLYTDDELRPAVGRLLQATGDTETSQRLLNVAMDAATASGKPVVTVAEGLAKAYGGNTSALKRLFPYLDDATIKSGDMAAILKEVEKRTKGAAAAGADQNQWGLFVQNLDELKESLGGLANSSGGISVLKKLNRYLLEFKGWVDSNPDTFNKVATGVAAVTGALVALKAALVVTTQLQRLLAVLSSPFTLAVGWVAFEQWLEKMKANKGGVYTVLYWVKRLADFMANPAGGAFRIAMERIVSTLETMWNVARNLWNLFTGSRSNAAPTGNTGLGGATGVTRGTRTTALSSGSVGKLTPTATPAVTNVYVDGVRAPARTAVQPVFAPAFTLGVV